jgi:hypothetical protein
MQNADKMNMNTETLEQQYDKVKVLTSKSHVLQWGDMSFTSDPVAAFFGGNTGGLTFSPKVAPRNHVSAHKATFHRLYSKYESADSSRVRLYTSQALQEQLKKQDNAEAVHWRLAELAYPGDAEAQHGARTLTHKPKHPECEVAGHEAIRENCSDQFDANSGWALKFHQVVVNICHDIAYKGLNLMIEGAAAQACGKDAKGNQDVDAIYVIQDNGQHCLEVDFGIPLRKAWEAEGWSEGKCDLNVFTSVIGHKKDVINHTKVTVFEYDKPYPPPQNKQEVVI